VREATILLTARVVHAATASSWRPPPDALSLALNCAIARSCHRRQTARDPVDYRPVVRPVLCGPARRIFLQPAPQTCPQSPFSSPQKCLFAGRKLVPLPGFELGPPMAGELKLTDPVPIPRARQPSQHPRKSSSNFVALPSPPEIDAPDPDPTRSLVPDWFRKPARIVPNLRASGATHSE
jgi:hypothetical protein